MSLKLEKLHREAGKVILEEKSVNLLREELLRSLGPTIVTSYGLKVMAESANNVLDVMEKTGKTPAPIRTSLLVKFSTSSLREVRKLSARLLPNNFLIRFTNDKDPEVRAAAAHRLPYYVVKEMIVNYPEDDQLRSIYREKKLSESKKLLDDKYFDMYGDIRMGEAEDVEPPALSNTWYDVAARKLIASYGNNLERQWEESAVARFCKSLMTQGIEVDQTKLLDAVYDHLSVRDKKALEESRLGDVEFMPIFEEKIKDPVKDLLERRCSPSEYVASFEKIFNVVKCNVENPARKFMVNESFFRVTIPAHATIPSQILSFKEEKALDIYVKHWSAMKRLSGDSYSMSWSPIDNKRIRFHIGAK